MRVWIAAVLMIALVGCKQAQPPKPVVKPELRASYADDRWKVCGYCPDGMTPSMCWSKQGDNQAENVIRAVNDVQKASCVKTGARP